MPPPLLRTTRAGFTLLELMVTIAILAILLGIAGPALRDFVLNTRLTQQANDLMASLMLARSQAVKLGVSVAVCGKKNNGDAACGKDPKWNGGWLVVMDADRDEQIDPGTKPFSQVDMTGSNTLLNKPAAGGKQGAVIYAASGIAASGQTQLTICDANRKGFGRFIDINQIGRATVNKIEPNASNANLCP